MAECWWTNTTEEQIELELEIGAETRVEVFDLIDEPNAKCCNGNDNLNLRINTEKPVIINTENFELGEQCFVHCVLYTPTPCNVS